MKRVVAGVLFFALAAPVEAFPWKAIGKLAAHFALGAGTELAVSQAAGGPRKYGAGILAGGAVGAFKEGADAQAGRDSKKKAALHAFTILAGAGIAAAAKH